MYQADLGVQESTPSPAQKQSIRERIYRRWTMLHSHLHSAGSVLDPEYQSFQQRENEEVSQRALPASRQQMRAVAPCPQNPEKRTKTHCS